jgi:hypothetical protein
MKSSFAGDTTSEEPILIGVSKTKRCLLRSGEEGVTVAFCLMDKHDNMMIQ